MAWSRETFREQYDKLASIYDPAMWLYRLAGMRIETYRRRAVEALHLQPGDTVVDLGRGTGLNFRHLQSAVGAGGHIVGVDISPGMLQKARQRAAREGWHNVELVDTEMSEIPVSVSNRRCSGDVGARHSARLRRHHSASGGVEDRARRRDI